MRDMNEELILLNNDCDEWVIDNLMWQPGFEKGIGGYPYMSHWVADIKDSGKSGDERIYKMLKGMEKKLGVKL